MYNVQIEKDAFIQAVCEMPSEGRVSPVHSFAVSIVQFCVDS